MGGLQNNETGVDGGKNIRLPLMDEFRAAGYDVCWLGFETKGLEKNHYLDLLDLRAEDFVHDVRGYVHNRSIEFMNEQQTHIADEARLFIKNNPGILLVETRPNDDKPGYNFKNEYNIQMDYIYTFIEEGLPVFLWDQDGWCDQLPDDIKDHVVILKPYTEVLDSRFPMQEEFLYAWFTPSYECKLIRLAQRKRFDIGYVGNVYGRRDDFLEYFGPFSNADLAVCIQGNWLRKKYNDRDFSLDNFPNFMFFGSSPHWAPLPTSALSKSVFHFSNPHHQKIGLPTARVFETLMGKSTIFCSSKIKNIDRFVPEELIVDTGEELFETWNMINDTNSWDKMHSLYKQKLGIFEHTYEYRVKQFQNYVRKYFGQ